MLGYALESKTFIFGKIVWTRYTKIHRRTTASILESKRIEGGMDDIMKGRAWSKSVQSKPYESENSYSLRPEDSRGHDSPKVAPTSCHSFCHPWASRPLPFSWRWRRRPEPSPHDHPLRCWSSSSLGRSSPSPCLCLSLASHSSQTASRRSVCKEGGVSRSKPAILKRDDCRNKPTFFPTG